MRATDTCKLAEVSGQRRWGEGMGEGAKGLEGEMRGTMEYFAPFGLGFLRNLLIHWHMSAFISGPAASPQDRLKVERRGPTGADSDVDLLLPLWSDSSSIHQTEF